VLFTQVGVIHDKLNPTPYIIHVREYIHTYPISTTATQKEDRKMDQKFAIPHSSAPVEEELGKATALFLDLVERNLRIEAVARFKESTGPRFGVFVFVCGGSEVGAAVIWPEERKSANEVVFLETGCVACLEGTKISRGASASEELGGLLAVFSPVSWISSSSGAKRRLPELSIAFIGVKRPPNSSPGSPCHVRPSASVNWYLRVPES